MQYRLKHPDQVLKLQTAFNRINKNWSGANCGKDLELVRQASEMFYAGDKVKGENLIKMALDVREYDSRLAKSLDVPFREPSLDKFIKEARQGVVISKPLKDSSEYQARGEKMYEKGKYTEALSDFSTAIIESPIPNAALYYLRGLTFLQIEKFPNAVEDFSSAIKISPPNPALYFLRGKAYLELKNFKEATSDFESGLKLDPNNAPLKAMLAQAKSGKLPASAPIATSAPSAPQVAAKTKNGLTWEKYQDQGDKKYKAGDLRGSIKDYSTALSLSPPNPALYFLRGKAYLELKNFKEATSDFESGLKLDPNNAPLKAMLAQAKSGK
jgi:tetratricopeptide (TPR) repeat protein